jgi:hypothetical protein
MIGFSPRKASTARIMPPSYMDRAFEALPAYESLGCAGSGDLPLESMPTDAALSQR